MKKQESNAEPEKNDRAIPSFPESASWTADGFGWNIRSSMPRCRKDPLVSDAQPDAIVAMMAKTLCCGMKTISAGGEEQPAAVYVGRRHMGRTLTASGTDLAAARQNTRNE